MNDGIKEFYKYMNINEAIKKNNKQYINIFFHTIFNLKNKLLILCCICLIIYMYFFKFMNIYKQNIKHEIKTYNKNKETGIFYFVNKEAYFNYIKFNKKPNYF
jgi:hypothetical protein